MPAIEKLKIKGFKVFPTEFELKLGGKHLLLYGENGSGKSSIYYALHCLYQSPLKGDAGKKYFNRIDEHGNQNNQHLINLNVDTDDSKITLIFDSGHPFIYEIDKDGYNTHLAGSGISLPGQVEGVFINHKFIFNFFHFHNSEYINLFPVFEKDILPYVYVQYRSNTVNLGKQYESLINNVPKNGRRVNASHHKKVQDFNESLETIINQINLSISDIYNNYFNDIGCRNLRIKLYYGGTTDGRVLNGYWLKYDYLRFLAYDNGVRAEKTNSYRSHNDPFIRLDVEEEIEPSVYRVIEKPQTYFNEAKLTAIALSIRFALLDLISPPNGRFLALDDMLISLDMSNRTKVIDFLLSIADKYKIYLFTHDKAFFERARREIIIDAEHKKNDVYKDWLFYDIHNDSEKPSDNPVLIPALSHLSKAKKYFDDFDYPACANSMRKELEEILTEKYLKQALKNDDGTDRQTLKNSIEGLLALFDILNIDKTRLEEIDTALYSLLNPLSHNDYQPLFRSELKHLFTVLLDFRMQLQDLDIRTVVHKGSTIHLYFDENATTKQKYSIILNESLFSFCDKGNLKTNIDECTGYSAKSQTIISGNNQLEKDNKHYKGKLEEICKQVYTFKGSTYNNDFIDHYYGKNGKSLTDIISNR